MEYRERFWQGWNYSINKEQKESLGEVFGFELAEEQEGLANKEEVAIYQIEQGNQVSEFLLISLSAIVCNRELFKCLVRVVSFI